MKITVKLHGILRDYRPQGVKVDQFEIDVNEAAVARHAAEHFGIPPQRVHAVFVNGEEADLKFPLHAGDHVRLFPPVVGGSDRADGGPWRIFVGGIMQGSRHENTIDAQDYRRLIGQCLRSHLPNVEVIDPFEMHPNSVVYNTDEARRTLIALAQTRRPGRCRGGVCAGSQHGHGAGNVGSLSRRKAYLCHFAFGL